LIFMMSSAQILTGPDGRNVGKWMPHVMVYYPQMRDTDYGLVASKDDHIPSLVEPGSPMSALVVVTHDWVDTATTTQ
jgi:hypothetical protein